MRLKINENKFKDLHKCKGCGKPLSQCTCEIDEEILVEDEVNEESINLEDVKLRDQLKNIDYSVKNNTRAYSLGLDTAWPSMDDKDVSGTYHIMDYMANNDPKSGSQYTADELVDVLDDSEREYIKKRYTKGRGQGWVYNYIQDVIRTKQFLLKGHQAMDAHVDKAYSGLRGEPNEVVVPGSGGAMRGFTAAGKGGYMTSSKKFNRKYNKLVEEDHYEARAIQLLIDAEFEDEVKFEEIVDKISKCDKSVLSVYEGDEIASGYYHEPARVIIADVFYWTEDTLRELKYEIANIEGVLAVTQGEDLTSWYNNQIKSPEFLRDEELNMGATQPSNVGQYKRGGATLDMSDVKKESCEECQMCFQIEELSDGETIEDYEKEASKYGLKVNHVVAGQPKIKITGCKKDVIEYFKSMGISEDALDLQYE